MAILAVFTGNITRSQYEAMRKEVDWEGQHPAGGIFHAAAFDDYNNMHVADIWESSDAMNAFVEQRLMPVFKKLAVHPPEVAVYPIHNINVYEAIDRYRLEGVPAST